MNKIINALEYELERHQNSMKGCSDINPKFESFVYGIEHAIKIAKIFEEREERSNDDFIRKAKKWRIQVRQQQHALEEKNRWLENWAGDNSRLRERNAELAKEVEQIRGLLIQERKKS